MYHFLKITPKLGGWAKMSQINFHHSPWRVQDQFIVYESYPLDVEWFRVIPASRKLPHSPQTGGGCAGISRVGLFPYPPHTKLDIIPDTLGIMREGQALRSGSPFANIESVDNAHQRPKVYFYFWGLQVTLTLGHGSFSHRNLRSYLTTYTISRLK